MVKVKCAYCGKELNRKPSEIKQSKTKRFYCSSTEQMKYEYANGIRDKFETTKSANQALRDKTIKRFNEGTCRRYIGKRGYEIIYLPDVKDYLYHHYVWEKANNCKVPKGFHLHHKNGNRLDNRLENLELISLSEHSRIHYKNREIDSKGRFLPK